MVRRATGCSFALGGLGLTGLGHGMTSGGSEQGRNLDNRESEMQRGYSRQSHHESDWPPSLQTRVSPGAGEDKAAILSQGALYTWTEQRLVENKWIVSVGCGGAHL